MLSAQKQKMPSQTPPGASQPPTTTGFGKVLHSIQGLQQRLNDFSIEEVSRSHARAHELIRELGNLRTRLESVTKLKDAIDGIGPQIAAMPDADLDLVSADGLAKYPQLHAILETHDLLQKAKANVPAVHDVGESVICAWTPMSSSASIEKSAPEAAVNDTRSPVPQEPKPAPTYEFNELRLVETPRAPRKDDLRQSSDVKATATRTSNKPKGKAHFDQRLLNELIETYGEFAVSSKLMLGAEMNQTAPAGSEEIIATATTGSVPQQSTELAVSPVPSKDSVGHELVPLEPAFLHAGSHELLALSGPAEQSGGPSFVEAATTAKARGEIDRQLKSIIKDYGEVDLYSHRRTPKIKIATIAAAAALALLLTAFYFFSSPSTPAPASMDAVEMHDPSAMKILKQEN